MAAEMTHWERVRAVLKGQEVDRVPVSMWRHFYAMETTSKSLSEAMLGFQKRFDWDFMKVNPRASYHVEDWGVKVRYSGDSSPTVTGVPVKVPEDWLKIQPLDINKGVLGEHLAALEAISRGLKGRVPFLMTVFTPLSIAGNLVKSEDVLVDHLREYPGKVNQALEVIIETFAGFSKACLERGASGLFYATTAWATSDRFTEEEYRRIARPSDLKFLAALPSAEFHILHVCRHRNLLRAVADYPVHAFNWDSGGIGNPSLMEGRAITNDRVVIGGIAQGKSLVDAHPVKLEAEISGMKVALGRKGWMLGPGCTFRAETPEANLRAIRDAVAADEA